MLGTIIKFDNNSHLLDKLGGVKRVAVKSKTCSDGLHLVCKIDRRRFRLLICEPERSDDVRIILSDDPFILMRSGAQLSFLNHLLGAISGQSNTLKIMTGYQRQRLSQSLRILDARKEGASIREIAYGCIFRNTTRMVGAAWKGSSEKRHTLRLLAAARQMALEGYKGLLSEIPDRFRIR